MRGQVTGEGRGLGQPRMPLSFEREVLQCPGCEYDVAQTIHDGIETCPECGGAVSVETCQREIERLPRQLRRFAYFSWALPFVLTFVGLWFGRWVGGLAMFLAAQVAVYAGWVRVEMWLRTPNPWTAAIAPTAALFLLEGAAAFVLGPLVLVLVLALAYTAH